MQIAPRLLHLAAHHIESDKQAPIFSALQLAGQVLSVEQCYDLLLRGSELVVLSGCKTAAGLDTGGALLAFQSAFLGAGAQHILSSLWSVHDRDVATWMQYFYSHYANGGSPSMALQRTQRSLLADPAYRHPALWAAFGCSRR
ncbi:MAG: CHAT domain-containing protein [Chloroflexaceae bacterium]|nr:CHAT domain-containing protein [Chloroflexaceae bacterium]